MICPSVDTGCLGRGKECTLHSYMCAQCTHTCVHIRAAHTKTLMKKSARIMGVIGVA